MGTIYLNTYRPMAMPKYKPLIDDARRAGVRLMPFVAASCRREPDFENALPSITAIGRGKNFPPKLQVGDVVIYLTVKDTFGMIPKPHRRLTGVLRVSHRFESHEEAAAWYQEQGLPLPSSCLVAGNDPVALERTSGEYCDEDDKTIAMPSVEMWDRRYKERVALSPNLLVCEVLYKELQAPRAIDDEDARHIYPTGKMPPTRTPATLTPETARKLLEYVRLPHVAALIEQGNLAKVEEGMLAAV